MTPSLHDVAVPLLLLGLAMPPDGAAASPEGTVGSKARTESPSSATVARETCEVPPELASEPEPLPGLSSALKDPAKPLTVVVLGSLSGSAGSRASSDVGFTKQLQAFLREDLSARGIEAPVRVEMVGRTRALAGELTDLITRQVLPLNPALVIWQVGRADARQGNPPHRFSKSLAGGLDILEKQGVDTILSDIQFHPQFEALYRTDDYRHYLRWLAGKRDLPLLRRYEMIEHWASSGQIDLDSGDEADQQAAYAFIQTCVADQAARMILAGAGLVR